jgi:glycine/D-amino acid oxidase-like deaminating enzyme
MTETFVIVGAGLAGGGAAATLREEGFNGRVVLIGPRSLKSTCAANLRSSRLSYNHSTSTVRTASKPDSGYGSPA